MSTVLLVVPFTILDANSLNEYKAAAKPTILAHGGAPVASGDFVRLAGTSDHTHISVFRFPSQSAVDEWHNSDDYQALVPLRERAIQADLLVVPG